MEIIETSVFTRRIRELLSDEDYRQLQIELVETPELGRVIPGSGGLRKLRWARRGGGKSGGIRAIYFWIRSRHIVLMLAAYSKSDQTDLSPEQVKLLREVVEAELK